MPIAREPADIRHDAANGNRIPASEALPNGRSGTAGPGSGDGVVTQLARGQVGRLPGRNGRVDQRHG